MSGEYQKRINQFAADTQAVFGNYTTPGAGVVSDTTRADEMVFTGQVKHLLDFILELPDDEYVTLCRDMVNNENSVSSRALIQRINHFRDHGGDMEIFRMGQIHLMDLHHELMLRLSRSIFSKSDDIVLGSRKFIKEGGNK